MCNLLLSKQMQDMLLDSFTLQLQPKEELASYEQPEFMWTRNWTPVLNQTK